MRIAKIEPRIVDVSEKTKWFFVKMTTDDGLYGYGEASLFGWEPALLACLEIAADRLAGHEIQAPEDLAVSFPDRSGGRVSDSVLSALEVAFWDIRGKELGKPVHALLGTARTDLRFYANINRGTLDRSIEGWVSRAVEVRDKGFRALKMAPFDAISLAGGTVPDRGAIGRAIEKVAAVHAAVGKEVEVFVDCHWRLNPALSGEVLRSLAVAGVQWMEAPFDELPRNLPALAELRRKARDLGVTLAGAETLFGCEGFAPILQARAYDVVMPDLRWCGGLAEGLRIAGAADAAGALVAPHNSAGPVLSAASVHFAFAIPNLHSVELQYGESPLYFGILSQNAIGLGAAGLPLPTAPGLGIDLDEGLMSGASESRVAAARILGQPGSGRFG